LAAVLTAQSATAAPVGLAVGISTAALAGATKTSSSLMLLKLILMTKIKTIVLTTAVVALLAGGTVVALKYERSYTPSNPDPSKVLQEAQADTAAGRYKESLEKHLWYHENALRLQPAQQGVRLSFALSDWAKLGESYPAALKKLRALRDRNAKALKSGDMPNSKEAWPMFQDFAAINRTLKEEPETEKLFKWFDAHLPNRAGQFYDLAEPSLLAAKDYMLCGKYIQPDPYYNMALAQYRSSQRLPASILNGPSGKMILELGRKTFTTHCATLVALLALNNRATDAERMAVKALQEVDEPDFHAQLDEAKTGAVPE
jgi:hypothetical protein